MSACKDCKWWNKDYGSKVVGKCELIDTIQADKDPKTQVFIDVFIEDDSGLNYKLMTGPEFGCVRFESKHGEGKVGEFF